MAAETPALITSPVVLVLDDEKNIRRSIEIALEQEGMHVLCAHDPAAALRVLHERIVDALSLDIRLGELDGIAFFRKIRAEGFDVPVIFISGNATLTEAAQAVKIGAFDFLEKPFSAERVCVAVKRCLEFSAVSERLRLIEARNPATEIVGDSAAIRKVLAEAVKVAATSAAMREGVHGVRSLHAAGRFDTRSNTYWLSPGSEENATVLGPICR